MERLWIGLGALAGLCAVAFAAIAAHALGGYGAAAQAMVQSALRMQGWHALALLATGLWARRGGRLAHAAGACFALGIVAFCGAVYALALGGVHLGILAPTGGMLLMAGWALLGVSAFRAELGKGG
ncbi:MAG: DUF423 domain-containing protein [Rhodospirillales bacterium]|nr:DUF423 domain-containing protein [Rhodospirillales bacterium]